MSGLLENLGLNNILGAYAASATIFVAGLLLAVIINKVVFPVVIRLTQLSPTNLDSRLITSVRAPATLGVFLIGVYLAIILPWQIPELRLLLINIAGRLAGIVIVAWALVKGLSAAFTWYTEEIANRTESDLDDRLVPLGRRLAIGVVLGMSGLLVLDQLNVNISPLIAGLGLGGLAVALALQPTLANVFAGTYVMTEGVVTPGDYIELENGVAGYVIDVSWRSTRLRTWHNNLVVIPNARFAETIITNYQEPQPAVNVFLPCGVSYESDLRLVQQICQDVMDRLLETDPDAVKEYGGWFGFESFGESNVDFWLFIQARNRLASFPLRTKLMQDLHRRLLDEGIVINYPVRALQFPPGWSPNGIPEDGKPDMAATQANRRRRRERRPAMRQDAPAFPQSINDGDDGDGPGAAAGLDGPDVR
jgi:small-conductance mechanosensitive channel